eukprot:TRINITY_DN20929_c0_g1_i1.p1 TRINITY_DN20929_c0_g1~~TRINITY_DN20929_c0_g1_i1.p1  ORF type:complete len:137 (-),score=29.41 TRINITY_DN20929_c0_g1_i1:10-420(-)
MQVPFVDEISLEVYKTPLAGFSCFIDFSEYEPELCPLRPNSFIFHHERVIQLVLMIEDKVPKDIFPEEELDKLIEIDKKRAEEVRRIIYQKRISSEMAKTILKFLKDRFEEQDSFFSSILAPVSYTHLTLPTIYSV